MMRNHLITELTHYDNDTVTVDVGGIPVDIAGVIRTGGTVTIVLEVDELKTALEQMARDIAEKSRTTDVPETAANTEL